MGNMADKQATNTAHSQSYQAKNF